MGWQDFLPALRGSPHALGLAQAAVRTRAETRHHHLQLALLQQRRRSLCFVKDMQLGDVITKDAVRSVRPGYGLVLKYLESIIGRSVKQDINVKTPVRFELLAELKV